MSGVSALEKETPESSLPPSTTLEKTTGCEPGSELSHQKLHLDLGLPNLQNYEAQISVA